MSFWDRIKPAAAEPKVVAARMLQGGRALELAWDDGGRSAIGARLLRQTCPCAACVDEWTNARTLNPDQVPEDIAVETVSVVGNYALSIAFSDQHSTGIFNWPQLRSLGPVRPGPSPAPAPQAGAPKPPSP